MPVRCENLTENDEQDLVARAYVAYKEAARRGERVAAQPALARCRLEECEGKSYVTLSDSTRTLAVFRVKPTGVLRRMIRPPKALLSRT